MQVDDQQILGAIWASAVANCGLARMKPSGRVGVDIDVVSLAMAMGLVPILGGIERGARLLPRGPQAGERSVGRVGRAQVLGAEGACAAAAHRACDRTHVPHPGRQCHTLRNRLKICVLGSMDEDPGCKRDRSGPEADNDPPLRSAKVCPRCCCHRHERRPPKPWKSSGSNRVGRCPRTTPSGSPEQRTPGIPDRRLSARRSPG